ncbi:pyridoxal phosphate-dependent aminotransferase [Portibacter marinus]|uniref:pyridoxal phosphate-dependent aminotransferase n=1 Tax=Portibacter marinus TaxID=2898660 RepID=UPI001F25B834|nr:aminotransferase class I/II-fold pyridoxal phosphate-dependent enzyme [Portibacter marinus]
MIVKPASRLDHVQEYYFSHKLREVTQMNADGKDVINLGIGKPDLPPPLAAVNALNASANDESNHGYQSYTGSPELRAAFAEWYIRKYDVSLNPATEILPLIGSKEGIMHISMSFLESGDKVLIPNPGYPAYASASKLSGATCVYYNLKEEHNWLPNIEELQSLDTAKIKLMWINYPHMPTGARADRDVMEEVIAFCIQNEILLCHDNPYSFILNPDPFSIFSIEDSKKCALELNSLSKSHNMSGWRVGMLAGSSEYIKTVLKFKSNMDSGMFRAIQDGAIAALQAGNHWYASLTKKYLRRKKAAEKIIELLECQYQGDQSGMFLWAKINEQHKDAKALADQVLYGANVFLTPGNIFGSNGDQYIRISLCQPTALINEAFERIRKFKEEQ